MFRRHTFVLLALAALTAFAAPPAARAGESREVKQEGYAEYRKAGVLVVDGQRVWANSSTKFNGHGKVRDFASIPLGFEVKVKGVRQLDGTILASQVEVKPNGSALFEGDLKQEFDKIEKSYRDHRRVYQEDEKGNEEVIGKLRESGPDVRRVRRIADRLVPGYLDPSGFRVYVVDNDEWNAMAAPNGAIFVYRGLLEDLDDDELAIVLGHELVHATHEHSRKGYKRSILIGLTAASIQVAAEAIDNDTARGVTQVATALGALAWGNAYDRRQEDQADRVGVRYAYEAGFDVSRAPALWERFRDKYGDVNPVVGFFFGDHSTSSARAAHLSQEIAWNYGEGQPRSRPDVREAGNKVLPEEGTHADQGGRKPSDARIEESKETGFRTVKAKAAGKTAHDATADDDDDSVAADDDEDQAADADDEDEGEGDDGDSGTDQGPENQYGVRVLKKR